MLTLELLAARLRSWASTLGPVAPREDRSPILLYQALFALFHDLKSSISLSGDKAVRSLAPLVARAEPLARALAQDEGELPAEFNRGLYELAAHLKTLEPLCALLKRLAPVAGQPAQSHSLAQLPAVLPIHALLSKPFSWDALSRARATSFARHGYVFFERGESCALASLPALEAEYGKAVTEQGGALVSRRLEPVPGSGAELQLTITVLAAVPAGASLPEPWKRFG